MPYPPPETLLCHTCSSRGKTVCLTALIWVEIIITIIGITMKKPFCNKYKLFYGQKIFSEFQISSTVGEMKSTTHPFHPTGWNCTCSPHPIPSYPIPFPSISPACLYFRHDFLNFMHLEQAATRRTTTETIIMTHITQSSHHGMFWISSNFRTQWPNLLWLLWEQAFALSEPIKYFLLPCHALGMILSKLLTKQYPFENRNAVGKLFLNLF